MYYKSITNPFTNHSAVSQVSQVDNAIFHVGSAISQDQNAVSEVESTRLSNLPKPAYPQCTCSVACKHTSQFCEFHLDTTT